MGHTMYPEGSWVCALIAGQTLVGLSNRCKDCCETPCRIVGTRQLVVPDTPVKGLLSNTLRAGRRMCALQFAIPRRLVRAFGWR